MTPSTQALMTSWTLLPGLIVTMLATGAIYFRGWLRLRERDPSRFGVWQLVSFLAGMATLYVAVASPIDPFSYFLLTAHMVQHDLFLFMAPVLLWAGKPVRPLLSGLPRRASKFWIVPFLRCRILERVVSWITAPVPAWVCFVIILWAWHLPQLYDLALRVLPWHYVEHAMLFGAAMLFWWPVFRPFPGRRDVSWSLVPYLFLAGVQGTVLSGILTFSSRVLYSHYAEAPRLWGISALTDQAIAGTVMWIPGSIFYLVALAIVVGQLLRGAQTTPVGRTRQRRHRPPSRRTSANLRSFDLLRLPVVARVLRWKHARLGFQLPVLALGVLIIYDGLRGPQVAPMNLAGVVPWIHWRWLLVVGVLIFGNAFCMACPFVVAGKFGKRLMGGKRVWPAWLGGKWAAVALIAVFFWAYEALSLWNSPWLTAWVAIGYFVGAFVVDGLFRRAAFCKHVCPVGQFNFVQSLISPLEVRIRDPNVCQRCRTQDCIKGRGDLPGCQTILYQPRKRGNMDCTFCLDCVRACPHDNVGLQTHDRTRELVEDLPRSGIGRFDRRIDLAALVVVLVFAAFVNAAGMIRPIIAAEERIEELTGWSRIPIVTIGMLAALVVLPVLSMALAAAASKRFGNRNEAVRRIAARYALALVPLGFSMWLAHYSFHFVTSAGAIFPAAKRFATQFGWSLSSSEGSVGIGIAGEWLTNLELALLGIGLIGSLYIAYRIARSDGSRLPIAFGAFIPWAAMATILYLVGVWVLLEPMQMRGTMTMMGGAP